VQVGILPTDSFPALVCDVGNKAAVQLLYELKGASPSKKLSILCRNFSDVSTYTLGFPVSNVAGQPNFYKIAKQILPGPYTLILPASKELPKQVTNYESGRSKHRSTVGVRLPNDDACQAVLAQLERPLLCSTARVEGVEGLTIPDAAVMADFYGPRGLAFIVDAGRRAAEPSTVVDLSGGEAVLVRQGKGDTSWLDTE
jgi:tRNA threonylcarbamoyl adenosine modification protein (Sua5/YciO/YrdC/YwlC family)